MSHFSFQDIKKRASSHEPLALCKKSLRGFSFKLHHCYLKINLLFTQNKLLITYKNKLFSFTFIPNYLFFNPNFSL